MLDPSVHVVFDLDDTLYPEIEYVRSSLIFAGTMAESAFGVESAVTFLLEAFENDGEDPIGALWAAKQLPKAAKSDVVASMRGHRPEISLPHSSASLLNALSTMGISWSILTDGRSLTQRRKIEALGIVEASGIYISEERSIGKPAVKAYTQIVADQPYACEFWYIGDNPAKDFVAPKALGWKTLMLIDSGCNIHTQAMELPRAFRADVEINELIEILDTD